MHSSRMRTVHCNGRPGVSASGPRGCVCLWSQGYTSLGRDPSGHSSRMHTIRFSGCIRGGMSASVPRGCLPLVLGVCLPRVRGDTTPGQTLAGHTPPSRHPPCPVHAGIHPSVQCMLGYTTLWTEFLTHACENITLLLRTVKNVIKHVIM